MAPAALASFHLKHKLNFPTKMKLALFSLSVVVFIYNLKSCKVAALRCVIIFGSRTPSKQTAAKDEDLRLVYMRLEKGRIWGVGFPHFVRNTLGLCIRVVASFYRPGHSPAGL
jgi:hypothetical protein